MKQGERSARARKTSRAFTLGEMLIVVVMTGLLAAVLSGGYRGLVPAARQEVAIGKARTLNAARTAYALAVPGATASWEKTTSDNEKVSLLITAEMLDGTPSDFLASPGGYTLSLAGAIRTPTVLRHQGTEITY